MNTKFFYVAAIIAVVSFSSCKKNYECECSTALAPVVTETHKGKSAEEACNSATKPLQFKICVPK
jgi:hypothetical protein